MHFFTVRISSHFKHKFKTDAFLNRDFDSYSKTNHYAKKGRIMYLITTKMKKKKDRTSEKKGKKVGSSS